MLFYLGGVIDTSCKWHVTKTPRRDACRITENDVYKIGRQNPICSPPQSFCKVDDVGGTCDSPIKDICISGGLNYCHPLEHKTGAPLGRRKGGDPSCGRRGGEEGDTERLLSAFNAVLLLLLLRVQMCISSSIVSLLPRPPFARSPPFWLILKFLLKINDFDSSRSGLPSWRPGEGVDRRKQATAGARA